MAYTLDGFSADCRTALSEDPGPAGRETVRAQLCQLLMEDVFVDAHCGPDIAPGTSLLYEDEELGFQIVAHIMGDAYDGGPHDHGASWAIYGQAVGYTDMTEWARLDDGSKEGVAEIKKAKEYRLQRGEAGIFDDFKIHSIRYPTGARFIRVTGVDLSTITRARFNPEKKTISVSKRENFTGAV
ncbi:MAG: hypothetical protein GKS01_05885 [Alphaproteobacteria bacterium]|nr:hypothetical protein [Alphaproteobacteria bacterium]